MNSGPTAERVYEAIKRRIGERAFRPGDRLDPAQLAGEVSSSVTPVRDALHLLTGEGLVEARTGDGFHLPQLDAPALEDLYTWTNQVLTLAVHAWRAPDRRRAAPALAAFAEDEALFASIAARSSNAEHLRAITGSNDRLRAIRSIEAELVLDHGAELALLSDAFTAGAARTLRAGLAAYYRRRRRMAAEIVRALYRFG